MTRALLSLFACVIGIAGIMGCGDGEADRRERAMEGARTWANENTELVIGEATELITSAVPGATLLSDLIAEQIVNQLSWEFSGVAVASESVYRVRATVSVRVNLDLPVVGEKAYGASLPFDLEVDGDTGEVTKWSVGFDDAWVGEE